MGHKELRFADLGACSLVAIEIELQECLVREDVVREGKGLYERLAICYTCMVFYCFGDGRVDLGLDGI